MNNLSYFEVWTIVSLLIFRSLKIQFVILEAGLGGRNDATHIISQSLVIAFTKIAFDHQNILGNTIEDITKNKSALITQGSFVVSSVQEPVVTTILKEVSKKRKAIWFSEQPAIKILHSNQVRLKLSINQTVYTLKLLGKYQVENVALVWQVMSVLEKKLNINFRNCAIEKGLNNAKMIGRLDVDQDNMIIRDGAHNISAVQALIDTLKTWHLKVKPILILGILSDKNYNEMIEILLPHFELIIAVEPNNSRALSSDELITVIKKKSDTIPVVKISSEKAMAFAKKNRSTEQYIVIAGSFYTLNLLGESND